MRFDPEAVASLLRRVAAKAIRPRFRRLARHEVREKGPGDFVTIADTEAERLLAPALRDLAPGSLVVGEEAVAADPDVLGHLGGDAGVWLIDPVDGTINLASGDPNYAVIVAYVERGAVCAGWIHQPERNSTVWAAIGEGAWRDGQRIERLAAPPLSAMVGTASGRLPGRGAARRTLAQSGRVGKIIVLRCSGCTYVELAEGRHHYAYFGRTLPWDHAAGWLLHREAGGFGAFLDGAPYTAQRHDHPLLFAPDRASWDQLRAILLAA